MQQIHTFQKVFLAVDLTSVVVVMMTHGGTAGRDDLDLEGMTAAKTFSRPGTGEWRPLESDQAS